MIENPPELLSAERIRRRVDELGAEITRDYVGRPLVMVGVLTGAMVFLSDLMRAVKLPVELELVELSSYGDGTAPSGDPVVLRGLDRALAGKDVLVVEDIVDTGATVSVVRTVIEARGPLSVAVCALLDKRVRRSVDVPLQYYGFQIGDLFVVGYGLDKAGCFRNLPYIGVVHS